MQPSSFWNDLSPSDPQFAVTFVDRLLELAIRRRASDVHLQPRQASWEVLFRIDGVLVPIGSVPRSDVTDPAARLMVLAGLPSYRSSQPQEGRLMWAPPRSRADAPLASHKFSPIDESLGTGVEMRLGTFPTLHGQRAVVRLFGTTAPLTSLAALSLSEDIQKDLAELCDRRDGVVLLAGPAGSGKTTTLYACLRHITAGSSRRSVLTIEDPIESVLDGVSQSQLNQTTGMTLATALRSAVRQDPEVLLVSEIRDEETADAVLTSSLTGHLCFSSIHASNCAGALRRLVQMELPAYLLRSGLLAVCSQRLLRKVCPQCGCPAEQPIKECDLCGGTGYAGRIAMGECVRFDGGEIGDAVMASLAKEHSADQIHASAVAAGLVDMRQRAWQLVDAGYTDAAEVFRVLGRQAGSRLT